MTESQIENNIQEQNVLPEENIDQENKIGGLGKFKDVDSLLTAYKNLEAEFTKKSQILKSLSTSDNSTPVGPETENEPEKLSSDNDISPELPVFQRDDWAEKVADFTKDRDISPEIAEAIAEEILSDESLFNDERCLEKGYIKYLEKKVDKANDLDSIQKYLDENPLIKQSVLRSFIKKDLPLPPNPVQKGTFVLTPPTRPRTLKEAGSAFKNTIKENKTK